MVKNLPFEIDEFFIIGTVLTFLMINYNLNLSSIYSQMALWLVLMYLVPILFNLFRWIPVYKRGKIIQGLAWGVGFGIGFIYLYNTLQTTMPIGQIFATTAFGESILLNMFVFGVLIAAIETVFFFRTLPQWLAYKIGWDISRFKVFSLKGIQIMVFTSAIFVIFHATVKGVTNNIDLLATFIFGLLSMGLILQFGQMLEAIILHITVNSHGVGLWDYISSGLVAGTLLANPWVWIVVGGGIVYYLYRKGTFRGVRLPFRL